MGGGDMYTPTTSYIVVDVCGCYGVMYCACIDIRTLKVCCTVRDVKSIVYFHLFPSRRSCLSCSHYLTPYVIGVESSYMYMYTDTTHTHTHTHTRYRQEEPEELVAMQKKEWDPVINWFNNRFANK